MVARGRRRVIRRTAVSSRSVDVNQPRFPESTGADCFVLSRAVPLNPRYPPSFRRTRRRSRSSEPAPRSRSAEPCLRSDARECLGARAPLRSAPERCHARSSVEHRGRQAIRIDPSQTIGKARKESSAISPAAVRAHVEGHAAPDPIQVPAHRHERPASYRRRAARELRAGGQLYRREVPGLHVAAFRQQHDRQAAERTKRAARLHAAGWSAQWIAAYMMASSVASSAENSSTTLPCLQTRMRSDSAMISGR